MPDLKIPSLAGGLADRLSDSIKKDDQLIKCENIDMDEAVLGIVKPRAGVGRPFADPGHDWLPTFIFRSKQSGDFSPRFEYLYIHCNYAFGLNLGDPTWTDLTSSMPYNLTQMVEDGEKIYLLTTVNRPKVFLWGESGNSVIRDMGYRFNLGEMGISYSVAPVADKVPIGNYWYLFIPIDRDGNLFSADITQAAYVHVGAVSEVTFSGFNTMYSYLRQRFHLGDKIHIYRGRHIEDVSQENTPFLFLETITWDALESGSWQWVDDNTPVPSTVLDAGIKGYPPNDLEHAVLWNNRMFGITANSSILRFSKEWAYEIWPLVNQIPIGGSDPITALVQRGNNLVVFKDGEVYEFFGTSKYNYNYQLVSSMHGTNLYESIQAIDNNRIIFIDGNKRVWLYDGQFTEISLPIKIKGNYFKSAIIGRCYLLWSRDDEGTYLDPEVNTNCYIYHIPTGRWGNLEGDFCNMTVVEQPTRGGENTALWFTGSDFILSGHDNYSDFRYPVNIQSKFFFSDDYQEKRFRDIEIEVFALDEDHVDGELIGHVHIFIDSDTNNSVEDFALMYDEGRIGQTRISRRFQNPILGKSISIQIIGNDNTRFFEIRDIRIHHEPRGTPIRS